MSVQTIFTETVPDLLTAKVAGAAAGSLISIAYVLPKGRREAVLRFTAGVAVGITFGTTFGLKIADWLGVLDQLDPIEVALMGSTFASFIAWTALGVITRLAQNVTPKDLRVSSRSGGEGGL